LDDDDGDDYGAEKLKKQTSGCLSFVVNVVDVVIRVYTPSQIKKRERDLLQ
jgi:hypothetical protein